MRQLGFDRFAVVGHDRGGRVACRMALDHPQAVTRLALLDIVPTRTVYMEVSKNLATWYFHWFFLIQPEPLPEMLLGGQAEPFLRNFAFRGLIPGAIDEAVFAEYLRCFSQIRRRCMRCARTIAPARASICSTTKRISARSWLLSDTHIVGSARRDASPVRCTGNVAAACAAGAGQSAAGRSLVAGGVSERAQRGARGIPRLRLAPWSGRGPIYSPIYRDMQCDPHKFSPPRSCWRQPPLQENP